MTTAATLTVLTGAALALLAADILAETAPQHRARRPLTWAAALLVLAAVVIIAVNFPHPDGPNAPHPPAIGQADQ